MRNPVFSAGLSARLLAIVGFLAVSLAHAAEAIRPNVIVILAADIGYTDLGCDGGEIETPNFDALARHGGNFGLVQEVSDAFAGRRNLPSACV